MAVETYDSDDRAYLAWVNSHPNGFVINTTRRRSKEYMVLHRATCFSISRPKSHAVEGGFTERNYIKMCADDIRSLRVWVRQYGRGDGSVSGECQLCQPV
jgi:hypothetical protein